MKKIMSFVSIISLLLILSGCVVETAPLDCSRGYEKVNDQCVLIEDEGCQTGYEEINDVCVLIEAEECQTGYEEINDECVLLEDEECLTGYEEVNDVCVLIEVEEDPLRVELKNIVTMLPDRVKSLLPKDLGGVPRSTMRPSSVTYQSDDIVLPLDMGYNYPTVPTSLPKSDTLPIDGIFYRVTGNVTSLIGHNGWVERITDMLWEDVPLENIVQDGDIFTIYDEGFEAVVSYENDILDISFFYAVESYMCTSGYDRTFAHYNDLEGFMIITSECYYNGEEEADQLIATYLNKELSNTGGDRYTFFSYESNPVGEDLLLTVANDDYSVTGIADRYIMGSMDAGAFELGHIVLTRGKGYNIGQMVNTDYYDRALYNWDMIFNLNAFDGWTSVEFDGTSPGVIYENDTMIPDYKVLLGSNQPFITQDVSQITESVFTEAIVDQIFDYPNNLVLKDYDEIKELLLLAINEIDASDIGLEVMDRGGLFSFMIDIQDDFTTMTPYYISLLEDE